MDFRYDSYCGLYCGACEIFQANKEGEVDKLAVKWKMEPNELNCHGCKSDINSVYCRDCSIKLCTFSKKLDYCFQCQDYPCKKLINFQQDRYSHHSVILQNLEMIQRLGVENWLIEQEKRWSCPGCQTAFTWYKQKCDNCGAELYDCRAEETDMVNKLS